MDKEEEITYWSIQLHAYETLLKALKKQNKAVSLTADDIIEGYIPEAIEVTKEQLERITNDHQLKPKYETGRLIITLKNKD